MDIISYLTTLIKTHKEVGIPGLGTIYKRKSPGRYDVNTHSFLPPSYTLAFTSDLKEETLLTELISKKKNISADSATYYVELFSENILEELSNHQTSEFGELGSFSTATGSLTFIPKQESNLGFDFYGLPKLETNPATDEVKISEEPASIEKPVEQTDKPKAFEETEVTKEQLELENDNADLGDGTEYVEGSEDPILADDTINDEQPIYEEIAEVNTTAEVFNTQPAPIIETPENIHDDAENTNEPTESPEDLKRIEDPVHFTLDYTEQDKPTTPAYLKIVIGIAVFLILAGVTYLAKPELFDTILNKSASKPVASPDTASIVKSVEQIKIDSIAHTDSIRRSNESAILAADSAKDSVLLKKTATPLAIVETVGVTYEIIAASLLNKKEADNFLADMKRKGIPAKVADMPGRRVKISIGSFSDEESAKKELEILKKTTKIPGIYIYKVRHTNNPK